MTLKLYTNHHIQAAVVAGLRRREVDVLTAFEDGANELDDPALLSRATALGRVLVSQDEDLVIEAVRRQRSGENFAGLIYGRRLSGSIGQTIDDLELIAKLYEPIDLANDLEFLPL